jgi:signal transduction histidine kinase
MLSSNANLPDPAGDPALGLAPELTPELTPESAPSDLPGSTSQTDATGHPIPALQYLEWMLLGMAVVSELFRPRWMVRLSISEFACLGAFIALGGWMPRGKVKWGYLALSVAVILWLSFATDLRLFQMLYVVLVVRCAVIFHDHGARSLITGSAVLLSGMTQWQRFQTLRLPRLERLPEPIASAVLERSAMLVLSTMLMLGLVLVFLQLLVDAIMAERRSREQLALANQQLRRYALNVEAVATLQERNRIAREMHDSLGHSLTAFNLHLAAALKLLKSDPIEAEELLIEAKQLGSQALQDVRDSVATLRADPLQGLNLAEGVHRLVEEFYRSTNRLPVVQIAPDLLLSKALQTTIFRLIQESLTNIAKHSTATQVQILISGGAPWPSEFQAANAEFGELKGALPTSSGVAPAALKPNALKPNALKPAALKPAALKPVTLGPIVVKIIDNGQGFERSQTTAGFGLQGMQERVTAVGGTLHIQTTPGQGCRIFATFPQNPHE